MDAAEDIVQAALAADVVLHLVDGKLGYMAEHGAIPPPLRARIVASKDAIVEFLKRALPPEIPCVDRGVALPLSFAQQSLWFINQLEGDSRQYHVANVLELTGNLDKDALKRSFDAIVQRHEVLRTTYQRSGEGPVQIVHEARPVAMDEIDLSMLATEQQKTRLDRIIKQVAEGPFDLSRDSMLRLTLVAISPDRHALVTAMHHIVSDGWSLGILMKELTVIYSALRRGEPHALPPLMIQYGDFACWQRRTFTHEHLASQLQYWRDRLRGAPNIHALPTDRPRQPRQTFVGRFYGVRIDDPHCLRLLSEMSARTGATLFMILVSAYALLLARWSNRRTIVLGTPIAGRTHEQLEPLLGMFLNSLTIKLDVCLESSFEELLGQTRQHALDAYANQDIPFEMLVDKLQPRRSLAHSPLFQMMFTLQNTEPVSFELPDLKLELQTPEQNFVKFDIQAVAGSDDRGVWITWNYAEALFDPQTMRNLGDSFEVLLRGILQSPAVPMHRLPLLTRDDLAAANRPQRSSPGADAHIYERFAAQVRANPSALALCAGNVRLSYAALSERAMHFANYFAANDIGPGTRVLVAVENAPLRCSALLALFARGAVCLTVEPSMLRESLADLIELAGMSYVLVETAHASKWSSSHERVLVLDALGVDSATAHALDQPPIAPRPGAEAMLVDEQLATHRIVALTHAAVAEYIDRRQCGAQMSSSSRMLLLPGTCHFAPMEWLLPLVSGAQLHVLSAADCASLDQVGVHMRQENITHLTIPAALLPHLPLANEQPLQHLVLTGCAVPESTAWRWARTCRVSSIFGVAAIPDALVAAIEPDRPVVYIPAAGTEIGILDAHSSQLPSGAVGEVHVGRYPTGMLGRQHANGHVEMLGPVGDDCGYDDFGVPLAIVEKYLSRCAAVANVVLRYGPLDAGRSLTAYAIPTADSQELSELNEQLKSWLPDYMLPDEWIAADEFPVTVQGRIDRLAVTRQQPRRRRDADVQIPPLRTDHPWKATATARTEHLDCEYGREAHAGILANAAALNVSIRETLLSVYVLLMMFHNGSNTACVAAGNLRERQPGYLPSRRLAHQSLTLACRMESDVRAGSLIRKVADAVRAEPVSTVSVCDDHRRVDAHLTDRCAETQLIYLKATTGRMSDGVGRLPLTLVLDDASDGLSGRWLYDRNVFEAKTIAQLSTTYRSLLSWVSEDSSITGEALKVRLLAGTRTTLHRLKGRFAAR